MKTFAIIAMGQMGSGVAARMIENGATVLTSLQGRSPSSHERAQKAGATASTDHEIVDQAEIILSILPPSSAAELAMRFLPLLQQSQNPPLFLDCNAIAPETARDIASRYKSAGLPFGDASIIGPSPQPGTDHTRLYMSGDIDDAARCLSQFGIDTRVLSDTIGDASAIKMAYAGITKGFQALGTAISIGAAQNGTMDALIDELNLSQDALYGWLAKVLPGMPGKAYRWDGEMREIAKFLHPEQAGVAMLSGAASVFDEVARAVSDETRPDILEAVERFAKR